MNYAQSGQIGTANQAPNVVKGSRINSDVERILSMARVANSARDRIARHSAALGYFEPPQSGNDSGAIVQPISNNLQSALGELDRALDGLHGALNLFD